MHEPVPEKSPPPHPQQRRFPTRRLVFLGLIFLGLCFFALWWRSGSRLTRMATHSGSFHLTSVTFATHEGTKILTDPEGLKYLEQKIARATIIDSTSWINEGDRWLQQGVEVTSTWSFSGFGKECRSMVFSNGGMALDMPGRLFYGFIPKPPFLVYFRDTRILEVRFYDGVPAEIPPSVQKCRDWIEQIARVRIEKRLPLRSAN